MSDGCRCCMVEENDMVYVFDILDEFDSKICDLIENCGDFTITEEDPYSKHICGNCLNDLANATRFRQRCLRTMQILLNMEIETKDPAQRENDDYQVDDDEETGESGEAYIEEIIMEQAGEDEDTDEVFEFSETQNSNDGYESNIQYIIADQQGETEMQNIDSLIENPTNSADELEVISLHKVEQNIGNEKLIKVSVLHPVQKEPKTSQSIQLNFVCQHCGAGFALQKNLTKHLIIHQNYACELCSIVFESARDLATHQLTHPKDNSIIAGVDTDFSLEDAEPETVKFQNLKRNHPCTYCGKAFVSNSALVAHIRVHTKEKPFPCSYCPKRFRTVGAQELHERRHSGVKPYKCDICGKGFAESSNLKVHRRIHTQEKPHVCTICNRAFARVFLLQIHQRTHTGERPFSCEDCGKPFNQQGDLAAHRRTHTGERPHRCDICGRGFIKSSGLTKHRKQHEQHQADKIRMMLIDSKDGENEPFDIATGDMVIEDDSVTS